MTEWTILGRVVGTGERRSWYDKSICIHEFRASPGINIPNGDVWFNVESGWVELYDDDGNVVWSEDIIGILRYVTRKRKEDNYD